jgi:putative phosphoribosyl transferase
MALYKNRLDAGKKLAKHLSKFVHRENLVILALPRGGVPVAYEVARKFNVPMDVYVVRKIGIPGQEESAIGAIASGGVRIINESLAQQAGLSEKNIAAAAAQAQVELKRREGLYRGNRLSMDLKGRRVLVVDDGMATGSTMQAVVMALRGLKVSEIIVAVPVASEDAQAEIGQLVDRLICLEIPGYFAAVGQWYDDYSQTTDQEVIKYMERVKENYA